MSTETAQGMVGIFLSSIGSFFGSIWSTIKNAFWITTRPLVVVGSLVVGAGLSVFIGGTMLEIVLGGFTLAALTQATVFSLAAVTGAVIDLYHYIASKFSKEEEAVPADSSDVKHTANYEARRKATREAAEFAASGI